MSELVQKIQSDLVTAMKCRDELKLSVLRMLKSAIQLAQVEKSKDTQLTDNEVLALVRRLIKQRNEAAEMYKTGGAEDRADRELQEAKVLDAYLPSQLSDDELEAIVARVAVQAGAAGPKDMGKVMGKAMAAVEGRADGNRVKAQVQSYLSNMA